MLWSKTLSRHWGEAHTGMGSLGARSHQCNHGSPCSQSWAGLGNWGLKIILHPAEKKRNMNSIKSLKLILSKTNNYEHNKLMALTLRFLLQNKNCGKVICLPYLHACRPPSKSYIAFCPSHL